MTAYKALLDLVCAHEDQQLTSQEWGNAEKVVGHKEKWGAAQPLHPQSPLTIQVRRFGPQDKGITSQCLITVYEGKGEMKNSVVVLAQQIEEGAGVSVTNAAEHYATEVCRIHNISPSRLVWIEHYGRSIGRPSWDRVVFEITLETMHSQTIEEACQTRSSWRLCSPKWNRTDKETVEYWIGGLL
jgi:hypothetical protein